MKRIISLIITVLMLATVSVGATTVEFIVGDTTMAKISNNTIDRQLTTYQLLAAPFIENDRTMVPVRALSESFNCTVSWDADLRQVKITNDGMEINLYIDSVTAFVNGREVTLDAAPVIIGDITFVPVRFVTENMGYNVTFIPGINSIMVYDQPDKMNIYGEPVLFPIVDLLNYNIALNYGVHPEESGNPSFQTYAEFLMNMYEFYGQYMTQNSLELTSEFSVIPEDLETAYASNFLKGELSLLFGMLGTESITHAHMAEVNAEEIKTYYKNEYTQAKHILISFDKHSEEEALNLANQICADLASGADFDAYVNQYNEDPGMVANPNGYLFTKGAMVKEFEDAAFALTPGAVSAPVKSVYGYHIIQGVELPEITDEIINECISTLYIAPLATFINEGMANQAAQNNQLVSEQPVIDEH